MQYFNEICSLLLLLCLTSYTHECDLADCSQRVMDLCLVVDASASICDSDPNYKKGIDTTCNNWKSVLGFVHDIVENLVIGDSQTRVSVVVFATKAYMRWGLAKYYDKAALLTAIDQLEYISGYTNTSGALDVVRTRVFFGPADRPNVDNVVTFITDGKPYPDTASFPQASDAVHASGIKVYAVGVTSEIDENTLQVLASDPKQKDKNYFVAPSFNDFDTILNSLLVEMCQNSST